MKNQLLVDPTKFGWKKKGFGHWTKGKKEVYWSPYFNDWRVDKDTPVAINLTENILKSL